jgi:hypothetical protein
MTHVNRPGDLAAARAALDYPVLTSCVAPSRIVAKDFGINYVGQRLGGRRPQAKFFRQPVGHPAINGAAEVGGGVIYVKYDLTLRDTAKSAAHETCHAQGSDSEDECYSIGADAERAWIEHRHSLLPLLTKRYKECRDWWLSKPASAHKIEWLCTAMGVASSAKASDGFALSPRGNGFSLVCEELDLRIRELEELEMAGPISPVSHLRIRSAPPAAPTYSFDRNPR